MYPDKLYLNGKFGKSTPELDKLVELSEVFGVSLDELVKDVEIPKENSTKKKKVNKIVLLIVWIILCVFLAVILFRYLSFSKAIKEYNEFMDTAKQNGGMVTIMNQKDSEFVDGNAFINFYFKDGIEYIQYFGLQNEGDSGVTYLYKTEFRDRENVYIIDEVNKTYTVKKRMSYRENGALDIIESKIHSNLILSTVYVKFPILYMVFNKNYHTSLDKRATNPGTIGIQKGDVLEGKDISFVLINKGQNTLNYLENFYNSGDRTKVDANAYFYSNIGTTLEPYLHVPDLTNYTLIEE